MLIYQYHTMFREFLLEHMNKSFCFAELKYLRKLGASFAEQSGEIGTAAKILTEAEEWQALVELIIRQATSQGALLNSTESYCHAYIRFQSLNDEVGSLLTVSAIINAYIINNASMAQVLPWVEKLHLLIGKYGDFESAEIEATILSNLAELILVLPHHTLFLNLDERSDRLIQANIEPNLRIAISAILLWFSTWQGNFHKANHIINEISSVLKHNDIPPRESFLWKIAEGNYALWIGNYQLSADTFSEGLEILHQVKLPIFNNILWFLQTYNALSTGNFIAVKRYLVQAESLSNPKSKQDIAVRLFLRSGIHFLKGEVRNALINAKESLVLAEEVSYSLEISLIHLSLAQILIEADDSENARYHLSTVIGYARIIKSNLLEHQALLIEAYSWIREGNKSKALSPLRQGLSIAAENDCLVLNFWGRPHSIAYLLSLALQHRIEVEYVKSVIQNCNIKAQSPDWAHWPWPIKIFTLGTFKLLINDLPLISIRKSQHKPLELLKYLLCTSAGKAINQDRIIDALWPDSASGAGEQALRTTLHRLRKLLQNKQAVIINNKCLSLNPYYVWADCWAFDHIVHHQNIKDSRVSLLKGLNHYSGPFLQDEFSPWKITFRYQLNAHYTRIIEQYGALLEQDGDWLEAIECFRRAIEIEPTIEIFYNKLMNIFIRLERHSDALKIYQRCRHNLLIRLGIKPSISTTDLYHKIINGGFK